MLGNVLIGVVAVVLLWRFQKSFWSGLSCSVALLASLPKHIQIQLPGELPAITVHRLIVVILLAFWLKERGAWVRGEPMPFRHLLICLLATQGLSLLGSATFFASVKQFLFSAIESFLYFVMLVTVVRDQADALKLARAMCNGLLGVAIVAFIEKYRDWSPMQYFPGYYEGTVMSTFSHRILLGTAMAMGLPLCLLCVTLAANRTRLVLAWTTALLCVGACFFAHSRGPWMAAALAGAVLGLLGSAQQRKRLMYIGLLAAVVLVFNSGVRETILGRFGSTFQTETAQYASYQWRWELWHKAWTEICKSPGRWVFGYGPGTTDSMNWEGTVSFDGSWDSFSSWDNTWASYLLECGVLGLAVLLWFYAAVIRRMLQAWRLAAGQQKDLSAFVVATLVVFIFMQTNVQIFAPQLYYLFWTTLALGIGLERESRRSLLTHSAEEASISEVQNGAAPATPVEEWTTARFGAPVL